MAGRAQRFVTGCGLHVADHRRARARRPAAHGARRAGIAALLAAKAAGEPEGLSARRYSGYLAELAVPEGRAPRRPSGASRRSARRPVGYFGITWAPRSGCRCWRSSPGSRPRSSARTSARRPGGQGEADHHPDRVRPAVGRRGHPARGRSRAVRRLRLAGEDVARQRGQAPRPAPGSRPTARPGSSPATRPAGLSGSPTVRPGIRRRPSPPTSMDAWH